MRGNLNLVLSWAKQKGDVNALLRLRIRMLPLSHKEGIVLDQVNESTDCSEAYLEAVRKAASEIVGAPCPH